jgi:hypothetical protein
MNGVVHSHNSKENVVVAEPPRVQSAKVSDYPNYGIDKTVRVSQMKTSSVVLQVKVNIFLPHWMVAEILDAVIIIWLYF